jgi:hypothetical protein
MKQLAQPELLIHLDDFSANFGRAKKGLAKILDVSLRGHPRKILDVCFEK